MKTTLVNKANKKGCLLNSMYLWWITVACDVFLQCLQNIFLWLIRHWWNGLDWTLANLYGKLSVLHPNSIAYLLACISKAFVLFGSLLSIAVSLEHLCPNFVIFLSSHWGRLALIAVMNKLHAVMLFNWLEMSRTANPPPTSSASPRQMNSWQLQPKGFFFVTVGACSSIQEANLAIYISNILIIYLSIHAEWADHERSFPVHSQWEPLCTRIDSRATTKHQMSFMQMHDGYQPIAVSSRWSHFYLQLDFAIALMQYWFQMGFAHFTCTYLVASFHCDDFIDYLLNRVINCT